jgi:hypothetical protein
MSERNIKRWMGGAGHIFPKKIMCEHYMLMHWMYSLFIHSGDYLNNRIQQAYLYSTKKLKILFASTFYPTWLFANNRINE